MDVPTATAPGAFVPLARGLTFDKSLSSYEVSAIEWLKQHDKYWDGLATGCLVFNSEGKVLIVQRASHDSMPNLWEVPGGAADATDPTLFFSAARELWEESGLMATHFAKIVPEVPGGDPGYIFTNRTGRRVFCRFTFMVEVESCDNVRLDPNEHQNYAWATKEEIEAQRVGDREIPITRPNVRAIILEGFRLREEKN